MPDRVTMPATPRLPTETELETMIGTVFGLIVGFVLGILHVVVLIPDYCYYRSCFCADRAISEERQSPCDILQGHYRLRKIAFEVVVVPLPE